MVPADGYEKVRLGGRGLARVHVDLDTSPWIVWLKGNAFYMVFQKQNHFGEDGQQFGAELFKFKFVYVERVRPFASARLSVVAFVGSGNYEPAVRRHDPPHFQQEFAPALQMLDYLKGNDQVEASIRMGQGVAGSALEVQVGQAVILSGKGDGIGGSVGADDGSG